ncbi:MAG TPA: YceI family protein [Bryobacteraceae bacterium]|nr:YceI family protein [Bryobacteraceae bacterium]
MTRIVRLTVPQLACALLLAGASTIRGQETALEIDPAQTRVEFTLGDILHTVHGAFQLKRGNIRFDPSTGRASGELVVDATSGASGNSSRDHRMHSSILESDRYPEIVFRPDHVEGKIAPEGASQVQVHGLFSIHGADHEIVLPADVQGQGGRYTATLHFVIPYVKWGLKNPSTLILRVSDKVEITIHTVARPAK